MPKAKAIDRMLATELSGQEKLKALFKSKGHTFQKFAQAHGFWPEQVKQTMYGQRPYPDIRDALAEALGLARAEIDSLIDGPRKDVA